MGWEDRRYRDADQGGGIRGVFRRIFWQGESFFDWAVPLYTAWGIRVRLHLVFLIMIIAELVQPISPSTLGFRHRAISMASLFVLVLLHEYGHCIACRRVGGTANKILMWPLGGLAFCVPPRHHWYPSLIITIGGPLVNVILVPVFAGALVLFGVGWSSIIFNPFNPGLALPASAVSATTLELIFWIWWLHYINAILLLFNLLVPMYPMDGARIVQELLWRRLGYRTATMIVVNVGLFTAVVMGIVGIVTKETNLLGLAIFGGFSCYNEKRTLSMTQGDSHPALAGYDFDRGYQGMPGDEDEPRASKAREKRLKKEQDDQAELDRILAKIASTGMGSLSKSEKRWLEQASERRRQA